MKGLPSCFKLVTWLETEGFGAGYPVLFLGFYYLLSDNENKFLETWFLCEALATQELAL